MRVLSGLSCATDAHCVLVGAYVADTYWGRFKTIAVSVAIALVGHVVLIVSALPPVIKNSDGALGALVVAILIMGLGTGGFKSNISPLVAEQQRSLRVSQSCL